MNISHWYFWFLIEDFPDSWTWDTQSPLWRLFNARQVVRSSANGSQPQSPWTEVVRSQALPCVRNHVAVPVDWHNGEQRQLGGERALQLMPGKQSHAPRSGSESQ